MNLRIEARIRARNFDVEISIDAGETVAVVGPNGAGKSTLLALLAGLITPDSGSATLGDHPLFSVSDSVPAHRRGISLLAQEPLLFPHLTVLENVAFGPRSTGVSRAIARTTARHWLDEVDAAEFADRLPGQLSGGQAQRIALARALAAEPKLLLLDEPMAALDVTVVPAMRALLKRVLADRTAIIVTHDVVDAFTLADRIIVLENGRVVDAGPTREVLARPRTAFAAALVGLNLLADGLTVVAPGDITISRVPLAAAPGLIVLESTVVSSETRGDVIRVRAHPPLQSVGQANELAVDVTPLVAADLALTPGDPIWLSFAVTD